MTRLNSQSQTLTFSNASEPEQSAHRLVVLVPCIEADLTPLALRVWEMAGAGGSHVRFLGLCSDAAREAGLRRKLITMSAMLNDGGVSAEAEVMAGSDWVKAVRSRGQAGDRLVCLAEQRTGLLQRPLSQMLASDLDVPLTILSGLTPPVSARPRGLTQVAVWSGSIAIVVAFYLLQAGIYQTAGNWVTVLMLVSLAVEFWLIWFWNSCFK